MEEKSSHRLVLPESSNGFPVADAPPSALGKMAHGLDSDSAVERLRAENAATTQTAGFLYPFQLTSTVHEWVDTAFREAFSAQLSSESPELLREAQETARQCMSELLSGTALLRLSPDALLEFTDSLRDLVQHVIHEAVTFERAAPKRSARTVRQTTDIRRQIRDQIASQKPLQDFKQRYLGWAPNIDAAREKSPTPAHET
jgi:hypothetical protein